jgi:25S rRNA (adenine(2142)-N(1))-methyltransferase, Bmt2
MVAYTVKILMYYLLLRSGSTFRRSIIARSKGFLAENQSLLRRVISSMSDTSDSAVADSLALLSPAIEKAKSEPPNAMLSHLRTRIVWALETWHGGDGVDANMRNDIAGNVVDAIVRKRESNATDGDTREQNKMLVNYGQIVAKAIRATPGSIRELKDDIAVLDSTINTYQLHLEKNRAVYININRHHESLVKKSYTTAVQNVTSLEVYAEAANSMGKKVWVQQGNLWMEDFSINFFRRNGARKDYLKAINHNPDGEGQREMATALPRDLMLEETFIKDTEGASKAVDMLQTNSHPARLIRLVDVGSCYNPIGKSANQAAFSVTPLDLCPVDPSVYQCDFLDLEIGPRGSVPEIVPAATAVSEHSENFTAVSSGIENGTEKSTESKSPKLLRLPAASYDVVAMSLVLNYLPTPALREKMIKKARQLLIPPGEGGQPHRAGLLLIIEKESIFSYDRIQSDVYHNKSTLLNCWKETICSFGFELVRYRNILTAEDHRRCHALAFRTIQIPGQTFEPSIGISEEHLAERSTIKEPSVTSTSTDVISSRIGSIDHLMLEKSLANKKLFEAGKSGMWIKQDFSSGLKEKKNNYNKNYKDLQDTFAAIQEGPNPTVNNDSDADADADAAVNDDDSVGEWDADGLGIISGKAKSKASTAVTPAPTCDSIKSNSKTNSISNSVSADTLPVAIVGGGLGGCALAVALQRKGIPYVMFEKDPHFTSRKQGYALTLQQVRGMGELG